MGNEMQIREYNHSYIKYIGEASEVWSHNEALQSVLPDFSHEDC